MTKNAGGNESAASVRYAHLNVLNQPYHIQDYLNVLFNLSMTVLIPLIVGQIVHLLWTDTVEWAKAKFYFTELNSVALLILLWSVLSDSFASQLFKTVKIIDYLIVIDASFYIIFSLLAIFFARLPNIFICCKQNNHDDQQRLLSDPSEDRPKTWVERWRFSREDSIAIMFCGATKTVAKGLPLINAVHSTSNQKLIGLLALPLIFYHVAQLVIGALEVVLLQYWLKRANEKNNEKLVRKEDNS